MSAESSLQMGDLDESLKQLQDQVRKDSANPKHRVFLFQLLAVLGNWERALAQLNVAGELSAENFPMVQTYRETIRCELLREKVFKAHTMPIMFGEPQQWQALLLESLKLLNAGNYEAALQVRDQAYEQAPTVTGTVNNEPFDWLADTDTRLGPVLELIVNGKYYWVPSTAVRKLAIEVPVDLRDLVWLPAQVTWVNGGGAACFIPTRYPGSETSADSAIRLARKTEWLEPYPGHAFGIGQKVLATNDRDYALFEIRELVFNHPDS
ncbi:MULTISPECIES: type VI secretion system accessory protein TagJ [Methylomicrobium]|uniref:Protein of avirulence locus involved in temperature-dependent protein secretion n=1 Tax=Methylomicrobium album BG8 TaxID=686340 RepID=H8GNM7_METAL|nr:MULTISPECIES: type VI secretion system accessory protein TagJ [Methylomicrobium]EIC30783.1 protein of avirulence locus involved in temperature-dependent protein secretion [Methylomicrobium album BG8]